MGPSVEVLENQYFLLRSSLSSLIAQGATDEQLDALRTQIVRSRSNYYKAWNSFMHEDDPQVSVLRSQMNSEQLTLAATIEHLGNVALVLDAITKAVDIGSQLAGKAMSL